MLTNTSKTPNTVRIARLTYIVGKWLLNPATKHFRCETITFSPFLPKVNLTCIIDLISIMCYINFLSFLHKNWWPLTSLYFFFIQHMFNESQCWIRMIRSLLSQGKVSLSTPSPQPSPSPCPASGLVSTGHIAKWTIKVFLGYSFEILCF